MVLSEIGVDVAPLLAGAGVVGVALGFGSQSLVKDFLSGMFILAEDQFGVGDVVDLDGQVTGAVEAVSLRTTRLRAADGTVWHVPNGAIIRVGNKSQHWARALLDVELAGDTDIDHAEHVINRVAHGGRTARATTSSSSPRCAASRSATTAGSCSACSSRPSPPTARRSSASCAERLAAQFRAEGIKHAGASADPEPDDAVEPDAGSGGGGSASDDGAASSVRASSGGGRKQRRRKQRRRKQQRRRRRAKPADPR